MLFTLLGAMASKRWNAATADSPAAPKTVTPIAGLSQRSAVEIGSVPLILAQGDGSLIKDIPGRHTVTAVGTMSYLGIRFFRAYLSQGNGAFIHMAVVPDKPNDLMELRLYQPYHCIEPVYQCTTEQAPGLKVSDPSLIAPPGTPEELCWTMWLLDNPDPNIGGLIGCPQVQSKYNDLDPATGQPFQYYRTWVPGGGRINTVVSEERIIDQAGDITVLNHQMMHYARPLASPGKFEYLNLSAVKSPGGASVNYWIGTDVTIDDLITYPAA